MKRTLLLIIVSFILLVANAQNHEGQIRRIYDEALTHGQSYSMLEYLSLKIGPRLSGSPQAAAAIEYTRERMEALGFDHVFLQEVMVPHWVRGGKEVGRIVNSASYGSKELNVTALGNSVGTGPEGILAEVVEVQNFEQVDSLGRENIEGKIVFFNRPMDPTKIATFGAYGGASNQRVNGASKAAKYGAVGIISRSLTLKMDDVPHTGTLIYDENQPKIPAVAISTVGAEILSREIKKSEGLHFYMETTCEILPEVLSYNVIGEIKGSVYPDEYIIAGGHIDSWDVGHGAHDDGAGCIQSIEALRILKDLGIKPKRTLRAVMFINEENGMRGALEYARIVEEKGEKHLAAIESDAGGFTPRGFAVRATDEVFAKISGWSADLLAPYDLPLLIKGGGGPDIRHIKDPNATLISLKPDNQRYFDYHHSASDTFDKVHKRELEMGAAAMATLIYLIDQNGL